MKIKNLLFYNKELISKDIVLLFLRIAISLSMIKVHGIKKLVDWQGTIEHIPDPLGLGGEFSAVMAIVANIIAPISVILGLLTRLSIIPILSVTLMGFFIVHGNDPWSVRDVPLMYSISFLVVMLLGPGKYSIDGILNKQ